jgi:hypothetical protein
MVGTTQPAESSTSSREAAGESTIGQQLEHQRLVTKTRRLEGVVAALQTRRRERASSGAVPPALDQALDDFTRQLTVLRARTQALAGPPGPGPAPSVG